MNSQVSQPPYCNCDYELRQLYEHAIFFARCKTLIAAFGILAISESRLRDIDCPNETYSREFDTRIPLQKVGFQRASRYRASKSFQNLGHFAKAYGLQRRIEDIFLDYGVLGQSSRVNLKWSVRPSTMQSSEDAVIKATCDPRPSGRFSKVSTYNLPRQ